MVNSYSFKEIAARLAHEAERVAQYLLPRGKKEGQEWCVGSIRGEEGKSLKIHLTGHKAGVWSDFAAGLSGDMLELWRSVKGLSPHETINEAKAWLGIKENKSSFYQFNPKKTQRFERPNKKPSLLGENSKVKNYLCHERKLTRETLEQYQIGESLKNNRDIMVFPSIREGEVIRNKSLYLDRPNDKKEMFITANSEPCLFGWHLVPNNARRLALFEGEIDAMTAHQYGITALISETQSEEPMGMLSVPMGGGTGDKQNWIDYEFERLTAYDAIYIVMDGDETGQEAERNLITRLGRHRCLVVKLPYKDMNECLQKGITKEIIQQCFNDAKTLDPEELVSISKYTQSIKDIFKSKNNLNDPVSLKLLQKGYALPWNIKDSDLRFRPDELSVWTGFNGHGKSQLLGYLVLQFIMQGAKVCIASLEMKPGNLGERLYRQISGLRYPAEEKIDRISSFFENRLFLFDRVGTVDIDKLLEIFKYARQSYGVDQFVIDSLMKCGLEENDYDAQKTFMDKICDFKNEYNCHVHLAAHPRKQDDEYNPPGKMDVKGSGSITDLADNCFTVWRNVTKEEKLKKENLSPYDKKEQESYADCFLFCHKQRNGEWSGTVRLWFDKESFQYLEQNQSVYSLLDFYHDENQEWIHEEEGDL